jgi:hypothetical protein
MKWVDLVNWLNHCKVRQLSFQKLHDKWNLKEHPGTVVTKRKCGGLELIRMLSATVWLAVMYDKPAYPWNPILCKGQLQNALDSRTFSCMSSSLDLYSMFAIVDYFYCVMDKKKNGLRLEEYFISSVCNGRLAVCCAELFLKITNRLNHAFWEIRQIPVHYIVWQHLIFSCALTFCDAVI